MPSKQVEDVYNAQRAAGKIDSRGRPVGNKLQNLMPHYHSDKVTLAARCIPTDIALNLSDGQLIALVTNIIHGMDHAVDLAKKKGSE